jgi:hypothetical protein
MKEIIFSSLVAAALVFSGCGGSGSNDGNSSSGNNGGNGNGNGAGNENGGSIPSGDEYNGTKFELNGLYWIPLKEKDDNDTISGRKFFVDAKAECEKIKYRLPTVQELNNTIDDNGVSSLKNKADFNFESVVQSNGNYALQVWSDRNDTVLQLYKDNTSGDKIDVNESYSSGTNFFTCVKDVNNSN